MVTMNRNKVVIVGTGQVGSTAAFAIVTHGLCNELVLIDHSAGKALGESHDLDDGSEFQDRHVKVRNGDYGDCKDADIVVITVGRKPPANSTRLDELGFTIGLVGDVVDRVMASGFNGVIVMVSNPVDVMAWYAWKRSGLPRTQVLGTGTALDTSRLKTIIGEETGLDPRNVGGFVMGEHGDSPFTAWSTVSLGGKPFTQFLNDNADRFSSVSTHEIEEKTRMRGNEIVAAKGGTNFRYRPCSTANTASATCSSACRPSCVPTAPTRLSSWNLPTTSSPNCIIPRSWSAPTAKGCCSRRPARFFFPPDRLYGETP